MVLAACAPPAPPGVALERASFDRLADWERDRQGAALAAFRRSCAVFQEMPRERRLGEGRLGGTAGDWQAVCAHAATASADDHLAARAFFESWFVPYLVRDGGRAEGLFTGYFEPELRGSRRPQGPYRTPIYARPADLVTVDLSRFRDSWKGQRTAGRIRDGALVPYDARAEIEAGALAGRGLEIAWVDDPVDAFFLHVQGSGRVVLDDGTVVRVGYGASNGREYVAIGRELVAMGELARDEVSMQSIRAWLAAHPDRAASVMARNPSFVFFRVLAGDGPVGSQGVPLSPGRSLAVDPGFLPLGAPVWLDTVDPLTADRPLRRLVVAQDTGSAIRGIVRGDLFWGAGAEAAEAAGRMRATGRYWVLLPRTVEPVR